jgi:uncharacterized protein involved in exopolysaccharide biosynthesis
MKRDAMDDAWMPTQMEPSRHERVDPVLQTRVTLRDILTIAFHDRRRIAAAFLIGLLLTAIAVLLVPQRYKAEASLLLRLGREYMYTPEVGDPGQAQPISYDREQTLVSESRILTSNDVISSALQTVGVANIYPQLADKGQSTPEQTAQALLALERGLSAELLKGSNLMQVSFSHEDPEVAAQVLGQVIESYLQKRLQVFASNTKGGAEADMDQRRAQLAEAEARLAEFKRLRGIRSFGEEQSLLLSQRNAIEQRLADLKVAVAQADGRASSLNRQLSSLPAEVRLSSETTRGEAAENARKVLMELRLKEREASNKYFENEPQVQDARANVQRAAEVLRELEAQPPKSVRSGRNVVREGAETELVRSTADLLQSRAGSSVLATQLSAINQRLTELSQSEDDLRTLERDRRLAEGQYEAAAKRLRDERVAAELDRQRKSNVSIVQSPMVPLQGSSPRRVVAIVGLLLSLCAALLVGLLSALWRDTFLTPGEVQRGLGVPLLASVPRITP